MNLLVIGISREEDLIIGYWYGLKILISRIPSLNWKTKQKYATLSSAHSWPFSAGFGGHVAWLLLLADTPVFINITF